MVVGDCIGIGSCHLARLGSGSGSLIRAGVGVRVGGKKDKGDFVDP